MKSEYKTGRNKRKGTKSKNIIEVDNITIRRCNSCKNKKLLEEFRDKSKSGFAYICRDCTNEYLKILKRNYRKNNPAYREWSRQYANSRYRNEEINRKLREKRETEESRIYKRQYAKLYYARIKSAKGI